MNYNLERLWILFLVPLLKSSQDIAHFCHHRASRSSPGTELICSGFTGLLRLETLPDQNVDQLSFSNNKIAEIDSSSFNQNLSSLAYVYFDNNNLTHISANTFKDLPKLKELDLSNNMIETFSPESFVANADLTIVDLSQNQIKVLDVNSINRLARLKEFILSNNPLDVCDGETAKTLQYLEERRIKTRFLTTCENSIIEKRDANDINNEKPTPASVEKSPRGLVILIITISVLMLLAIALTVAMTILCSKVRKQDDKLSNNRNRFLSISTQRSSINSEEDQDGYLRATIPKNIPQYTEVIGDSHQALLASINLEDELKTSKYHKNIVAYALAPISITSNSLPPPPAHYSSNQNVYEEIQYESVYNKKSEDFLNQPYSCVKPS